MADEHLPGGFQYSVPGLVSWEDGRFAPRSLPDDFPGRQPGRGTLESFNHMI